MNKVTSIALVSVFAILAGFFISGGVHATQASTDTEVDLNVATVINISTPDTTNINCASLNTLCTANTTIAVGTNNITGYTLQLNATSGYSNSLTNSATNETIPTLSQSYVSGSFPANYWGYTGGLDKSGETGGYNCASNYCPVLAYQSNESNYVPNHAIKVTDSPAVSSNTTITFGAKADTTKFAGTYSTSVTFTAVTNYVPPTRLANGIYMQDVDSTICANSSMDQTYTLIDSRDEAEYTVAKLQDGNCWMTQNLKLGQTGQSLTLNDTTSNVSSSGYDLTPVNSAHKNNTTTKYGNYYTWDQATAGSGSSVSGQNAPYDICPKNWRLPTTANSETTGNEFYEMLIHYITTGAWNGNIAYNMWQNVTISEITDPPISLVFSGRWSSGSLRYTGAYGELWSSNSVSSTYASIFYMFSGGDVSPKSGEYSTYGIGIRCLIPGL